MKKQPPRCSIIFLLVILAHFISAQIAFAFTVGEERVMGEKLRYTVRTAFPLLDDPDIIQYLSNLGKDVLDVAGVQYFDYHFFLIQDDEFNAFAAPSGLVFFYSGLIGAMNSEDELVSVLAHEIGHVAKRHLAGRMEKGKIIGAASVAMVLAAVALGGGKESQALITSSLAAGQSASLHFSRKDEEEADLVAYQWMKELKRNPIGQKKMLDTMRRISRYRSEKPPQYLLTHPNPEARLEYVQSLLSQDQGMLESIKERDAFAFLRFKYRVMSQADDLGSLREYLASVLADGRASKTTQLMAKYGMSQVERHDRHIEKGLKLIEEVIRAFPEKPILQTDKGAMLFDAGRYTEARDLFKDALKMNPQDMYASYLLGRTYQELGQFRQAQTALKDVSYEFPEYPKVYFELGKVATYYKKSAAASLYLGKFYLYEGKLKLARFSLKNVIADTTVTSAEKEESEILLELIEKLEDE